MKAYIPALARMPFVARMPALLVLIALTIAIAPRAHAADSKVQPARAPQFTARAANDWINSAPRTIESYKGKVLLIDVWTFECWNCYRSFPWLKDVEARLGKRGLAVVGIHSPEFDRERDRQRVAAKTREFGITHPVMIDNDFAYWKALDNQYWPAFYVIDRRGTIRGRFVGETHIGDRRAKQIESLIETLLAEAPDPAN